MDFLKPNVDDLTSERLLDERLRRAFLRLEALPQNQSGADRTARERANQEYLEHYQKAARVR